MGNKEDTISNNNLVSMAFMHQRPSTDFAKISSETWKSTIVLGGQHVSSDLME